MQSTWAVKVTRLSGSEEFRTTVQRGQPTKGDEIECSFTDGEIIKIRIIEPGHRDPPKGGTSMGAWTKVTAEEIA